MKPSMKMGFLNHVPKKLFEKRDQRIKKNLRRVSNWCYVQLNSAPFYCREDLVDIINTTNKLLLNFSEEVSFIEEFYLGSDKFNRYKGLEKIIYRRILFNMFSICINTGIKAPIGIHGKLLRKKQYRTIFKCNLYENKRRILDS